MLFAPLVVAAAAAAAVHPVMPCTAAAAAAAEGFGSVPAVGAGARGIGIQTETCSPSAQIHNKRRVKGVKGMSKEHVYVMRGFMGRE